MCGDQSSIKMALSCPMESNVRYADSTPHTAFIFHASLTVPLIAYAHGLFGGGLFETAYNSLFSSLSSFGYVVVAPRACPFGCWDSSSLPKDPKGWADWYKQQLKVFDYAHEKLADSIDFGTGIGIAGHSMGGQATLFSSSYSNASSHDIRAAVMHHAYTHEAPAPTVPFLAFTGGKDTTASPAMTQDFYAKARPGIAKGFVNRADADHMEPISGSTYNPLLPQFTAAWFKFHLNRASFMEAMAAVNGTQKQLKVDLDGMIFGSGPRSLCGGGDSKMLACETRKQ